MTATKINKEEKKEDVPLSPDKSKTGKTPFRLWPSFGGSTTNTTMTSSVFSTPK